jgi:hypothetical protein
VFKKFTDKFSEYTISDSRFINDIITEAGDYSLDAYLLNDIVKLLEKVILNKLSSDLLFQKNYCSWGFVTTYYSNFYMTQILNRIVGNFFMYKTNNFNKNIKYDKESLLYNVPENNNGETSHLREFKKLKSNFSYIKTWNDIKLQNLLDIIQVKNKDLLFKYTIDNEIKESEIRNEINYRLYHYKEIELEQKARLFNQKIYNLITTNKQCRYNNYPSFELLQINQKRFLFLSILIKEIIQVNPAFKLKLRRLNESLELKYNNKFHNVNIHIKNSIKGLLT